MRKLNEDLPHYSDDQPSTTSTITLMTTITIVITLTTTTKYKNYVPALERELDTLNVVVEMSQSWFTNFSWRWREWMVDAGIWNSRKNSVILFKSGYAIAKKLPTKTRVQQNPLWSYSKAKERLKSLFDFLP